MTHNFKIEVEDIDNQLIIRISNNGPPLEGNENEARKEGVGLQNVRKRLDTAYNSNFLFTLSQVSTDIVEAKISIPMQNYVLKGDTN